jgi:iron complex outermembrane receptor protein
MTRTTNDSVISSRGSWICAMGLSAVLFTVGIGADVQAQSPRSPAQPSQRSIGTDAIRFDISPQPLASALNEFAAATGLQVSYRAELAEGLSSPGVSGTATPDEALAALLAGTGLAHRYVNPGTVTLERAGRTPASERPANEHPVPQTGGARLPIAEDTTPIKVQEVVIKDVKDRGYVAESQGTATKSDTPLIETPQSITVVTRDRMNAQEVNTLAEALRYTAGVQAEPFGFEPRFTSGCGSADSTPPRTDCSRTACNCAIPDSS